MRLMGRELAQSILALIALFALATSSAGQQTVTIQNQQMSVTAGLQGGSYALRVRGSKQPVLQSGVAAEIDHQWLRSSDPSSTV